MNSGERCTNLNHGRWNAPVKYCPACGKVVNQQSQVKCNPHRHAEMKKQRMAFCHDCGKKLTP